MTGEFAWIDRLVAALGEPVTSGDTRAAIGDDAALVEDSQGAVWAWTVDTLVEQVHFRFDWLDAGAVGHRALAASLSDLAATGAEPRGALVSLAGPRGAIEARAEDLYRGLGALAAAAGCPVLGGDLARAEGPLHVTVTALGRCAGTPLTRSGARAGDELWLTGALGGPAAALALLRDAGGTAAVRAHPAYDRLARPAARVAEVAWLLARVPLRAAIDLSDGLSSDAAHMAVRSGVLLHLEAERLPVHAAATAAGEALGLDPLAWALHGGEEFELLLAAPAGAVEPHAETFARGFGIPLSRVGRVEAGAGLRLDRDGTTAPLARGGWDHFA